MLISPPGVAWVGVVLESEHAANAVTRPAPMRRRGIRIGAPAGMGNPAKGRALRGVADCGPAGHIASLVQLSSFHTSEPTAQDCAGTSAQSPCAIGEARHYWSHEIEVEG